MPGMNISGIVVSKTTAHFVISFDVALFGIVLTTKILGRSTNLDDPDADECPIKSVGAKGGNRCAALIRMPYLQCKGVGFTCISFERPDSSLDSPI